MKKVPLIVRAVTSLVMLLLVGSLFSRAQSVVAPQVADSLINITRLNDKTLLMGLAADAVTAIATQKGIVIIDAGISGSLSSQYRVILEKELKRNDFVYVINTHGHHDHTYGNAAFTKATIIAHENAIKEIHDQWSDTAKVHAGLKKTLKQFDERLAGFPKGSSEWQEVFCQRTRYNCAYEDAVNHVEVRYPDRLFIDTLQLSMGDIHLDMIYFGKSHSESDIMVYIPEMKMFWVGDLFFKYGRPSFDTLDKQHLYQYRKAIAWITSRSSESDIVINGHGQIMDKGDMDSFIEIIKKKI